MRSAPAYRATVVAKGGEPKALERSAAGWAQRIGPDVPRPLVERFRDVVGRAVARERVVGRVVGALAVISLLVVIVSTNAMVRQWLNVRQREIGVRFALGARAGHVMRWMLRVFGWVVPGGVVVGGILSVGIYEVAGGRIVGAAPIVLGDLTLAAAAVVVGVCLANGRLVQKAFMCAPADLVRRAGSAGRQ